MKLGVQEVAFIVIGLTVLVGFLFIAAKIKKAGQSNNTTRQP